MEQKMVYKYQTFWHYTLTLQSFKYNVHILFRCRRNADYTMLHVVVLLVITGACRSLANHYLYTKSLATCTYALDIVPL